MLEKRNAPFQVISPNDPETWIRDYRKRKFTRKTKSGCSTCKAKKVKCDEYRPVCLRCQRNCRPCSYAPTSSHGDETRLPDATATACQIRDPSIPCSIDLACCYLPNAKNGTSSGSLVRHFQDHWTEIFQMPHVDEVVFLSKSNPLVRNTILAISACHLRHLAPDKLQHRIAEHFQQSLALKDYQRTIETPFDRLGQSGVNALLLSGTLLMMLAFTLSYAENFGDGSEPAPTTSWVFSSRENRLNWLALQVGIKPLLLSMSDYLEGSMDFLAHVFLGDDRNGWAFNQHKPVPDRVPALWREFFGLEGDISPDAKDPFGLIAFAHSSRNGAEKRNGSHADVFRLPVKILAELRHVPPNQMNVFKILQFFGKVTLEFRTLLYEREERAMWLFAYWLRLLCRFEGVWWCDQRARRDYKAILMWLEGLGLEEREGVEGEMWREMMRELRTHPFYLPVRR